MSTNPGSKKNNKTIKPEGISGKENKSLQPQQRNYQGDFTSDLANINFIILSGISSRRINPGLINFNFIK